MSKLRQVGTNTYYLDWPAKVGIYVDRKDQAYLIDTGNDRQAGRNIQKLLEEKKWTLKAIINTHSHADHIGGNHLLQERLHCPIYSVSIENAFIAHPLLEPSYLYGGAPLQALENKFLLAEPSIPQPIEEVELPAGMELVRLDGHSFAMLGIKTPDQVWFVADSLVSKETIEKYHIPFLQDVKKSLDSLDILDGLQGELFLPSHCAPTQELSGLIAANRSKIEEIIETILDCTARPIDFDSLLQAVFDHYSLCLTASQYVLVGSTLKSYLSYLEKKGNVSVQFANNKMLWQRVLLV